MHPGDITSLLFPDVLMIIKHAFFPGRSEFIGFHVNLKIQERILNLVFNWIQNRKIQNKQRIQNKEIPNILLEQDIGYF
jgi:hypothetical protein